MEVIVKENCEKKEEERINEEPKSGGGENKADVSKPAEDTTVKAFSSIGTEERAGTEEEKAVSPEVKIGIDFPEEKKNPPYANDLTFRRAEDEKKGEAESPFSPFGKNVADKASVIFGQSEDEMRREFRAFKAAKLFKKFDCDLTEAFSPETFDKKLTEAKNYGFGAVVVTPQKIRMAKAKLKGTGIEVVAAVCFPAGEEVFGVKKYAVKKAFEKGADRVYVPAGISAVKFGANDLLRREFKKIVKIAKKKKVSVVMESGVFSATETERAVRVLSGAGIMSFVSSSGKIGFGEGVSSVKNIRYFLHSGSEVCGFTASRRSEDAVGLMSVADRLFVKNAADLAADIRANLKY